MQNIVINQTNTNEFSFVDANNTVIAYVVVFEDKSCELYHDKNESQDFDSIEVFDDFDHCLTVVDLILQEELNDDVKIVNIQDFMFAFCDDEYYD